MPRGKRGGFSLTLLVPSLSLSRREKDDGKNTARLCWFEASSVTSVRVASFSLRDRDSEGTSRVREKLPRFLPKSYYKLSPFP